MVKITDLRSGYCQWTDRSTALKIAFLSLYMRGEVAATNLVLRTAAFAILLVVLPGVC